MKSTTLIISLIIVQSFTVFGQQGPPAEVDNTLRATVQLMMDDDIDFKGFIKKRYSKKAKKATDLQTLENDLKIIKEATKGAEGIDIAVENNLFKIIFSEGNDAIVAITFDKDEIGKISTIMLSEQKDPSQMTEEDKFYSALMNTVRKIESLPKLKSDEALNQFIEDNFTPEYITKHSKIEILEMLKESSMAVATSMTIGSTPYEAKTGSGVTLELRGQKSLDVSFVLEDTSPYRIKWYDVNKEIKAPDMDENLIAMTWTNYQDKLNEEQAKGFSGVIYLVKDGDIVHAAGYGYANKENNIKNSKTTVFDIGSIPIDFTQAAILKLIDMGKINFSDPITKFIKNVPSDKTGLTISHLMLDQSGLLNFHEDVEKDEDFDLSWITRDEAVHRILQSKLLFKPGEDDAPSHSGYGLLAAIVEIISEVSYEDFLQKHFFEPLGMKNTGPYGKESNISPKLMAVGYGKQASKPNIPANWGPTSWLIKGSGGMVSTPHDLYLWNKGIHKGNLLSESSGQFFSKGKMSVGGTERGFFTVYLRDSKNMVIICANAHNEYADTFRLFHSLTALFN